jgi:aminoglycoside phosphotransferase (APT) family kinase protein
MDVDVRTFTAWVARTIGRDACVKGIADLSQAAENLGPWRFDVDTGRSMVQVILHVGDPADKSDAGRFAVQVTALELATAHRLSAPRVLAADLDASATGSLAILQTALAGSSAIPREPDPVRLRTIGRAIAAIHGVDPGPGSHLPPRARSLEGIDFEAVAVPDCSVDLFARARSAVAALHPQQSEQVFVHGDFWQGNTLWLGTEYKGAVDWDFAGVGSAGVDLGSLRCDIAVMYGSESVVEIATGWEEATGRPPDGLAYWDVVGCLCSPADLRYWLPNFHHQGRADLDWATVMVRRDAHPQAALRQIV